MGVIVFVRHGRSDSNVSHILSSDVGPYPLTGEGIAHATLIAGELIKLKSIDALYTSPVLRAFQTADIIGARVKLKPKIDERLSERAMGNANNKVFPSHEALLSYFKSEVESGYKNGMESWDELKGRMQDFAKSMKYQNLIVAVTHRDSIMAALGTVDPEYSDEVETEMPFGSATAIDFSKQRILCVGKDSLPEYLKK